MSHSSSSGSPTDPSSPPKPSDTGQHSDSGQLSLDPEGELDESSSETEDEEQTIAAAWEDLSSAEADEPPDVTIAAWEEQVQVEQEAEPEEITGSFVAAELEPVTSSEVVERPLTPRQSMLAGAVLGAAIGDAMGHPTEFITSFEAIRARYGPEGVTGFELYWDRDGKRFAPYTDDTQMAEIVLRGLLASRDNGEDLDAAMRRIGAGFIEWADNPQGGHRAPGNACIAGCRALQQGAPWSEAGGATAGGCGSVMRAYPFGLVFANDVQRAERWAVAHSKLTHRDPIALGGTAAMAVGVALLMQGQPLNTVVSEMVAAACRYCAKTAWMIARALHEARTGVGPESTLRRLEGWAAHEAIAAAVYLLARHPDDPQAAILEGANTPGDSDSLATLAGALVGARAGVESIPDPWVEEIERSSELWELALSI